jgi:hypothetical protein
MTFTEFSTVEQQLLDTITPARSSGVEDYLYKGNQYGT